MINRYTVDTNTEAVQARCPLKPKPMYPLSLYLLSKNFRTQEWVRIMPGPIGYDWYHPTAASGGT